MKYLALLATFVATAIVAPLASAAPGDYKEIDCKTQAFFAANSCNQCFDGGKVTVGQKITGFYDSWTNKNSSEQVAYKDEQSYPEMVVLGGSGNTWKTNPNDPKLFWKYGADTVWVNSLEDTKVTASGATASGSTGTTAAAKQEFALEPGKTVTFMEADLGASYALTATTAKKDGEFVGLMKFPVAYHDIGTGGKESAVQKHTECVAFAASVAAAPVVPKTPEVTKVKTGPEEILFIGLALILGFLVVSYRKRKA